MIRNRTEKGSHNYSTAILLSIAGGFLDAYTYYERGGVFANAQTGNIIKLGLKIGEGRYEETPMFLVPILCFCAGVMLSLAIELRFQKKGLHVIRRFVLLIQAVLLAAVSFLPRTERMNMAACSVISFVCALQMQTFREFGGYAIATTVGTGNLRQCIVHLFDALLGKDEAEAVSISYFLVILQFAAGVVTGVKCCEIMAEKAVLLPAAVYVFLIVVLTLHRRRFHG